jgi:hypothetical protein
MYLQDALACFHEKKKQIMISNKTKIDDRYNIELKSKKESGLKSAIIVSWLTHIQFLLLRDHVDYEHVKRLWNETSALFIDLLSCVNFTKPCCVYRSPLRNWTSLDVAILQGGLTYNKIIRIGDCKTVFYTGESDIINAIKVADEKESFNLSIPIDIHSNIIIHQQFRQMKGDYITIDFSDVYFYRNLIGSVESRVLTGFETGKLIDIKNMFTHKCSLKNIETIKKKIIEDIYNVSKTQQ